jgi:uncharacterized protein (DUF58 family)
VPQRSVTPDVLERESERLAQALPPLMVEAERLAAAGSLGVHGRRKAGMGEIFWQFRRYRAEDSAGAIDWRQSAKSIHFFVREREWEAAHGVWFWVDRSSGMRFGSASVTKAERASLLALALAHLLVRGGERVALFGEANSPHSSRHRLKRMASQLAGPAQDDRALPPQAPIAKNGQFVWLSDFLASPDDIALSLSRFTSLGIQGLLVHIIDPEEEDFPFRGRTRFDEPRGTVSETIGRAENVGPAYRARFSAHAAAIAEIGTRKNFRYLAHRTDRPALNALIALYAGMSGM